ncbi:MAG TPA: hypothetical protein VLA03_05965, partial [Draconibacterium sp.]|nr:hypothetical protein [Draconibacterium sp.]
MTGNFSSWITKADSLIINSKNIQTGLRSDPLVMVLGLVGESDLFPLIIKKADSGNKRKSLDNLAREMYPEPEYTLEEIEYSGHIITSIKSNQNTNLFHYCFIEGLYLASPKILLVEQSIRQLSAHSITEDSNFSKVNQTANSDSELSLYFNHKSFSDVIAGWMNPKSIISINEFGENNSTNYARGIRDFKNFAAWSELDIQIDKNEILMNGVSAVNDSLNHFLSLFTGQEPVRFKADDALPHNTAFFTCLTFSNKNLFFQKLENYFTLTDGYYKREDRLKKIEYAFRVDFKTAFQQLVKNEIIVAATDFSKNSKEKTTFFILQTEGKSDAESQLTAMLQSYAGRMDLDFNGLHSTYSIDDETRFIIYNFPFPSFPGIWLGKPFWFAEANYAAFYDNFLVFCNSKSGMEEYLYQMVLGSSLAKDSRYQQIKRNTESKTNINVYASANGAFYAKDELFNTNISKSIEKNQEFIRKINGVNWQLINEKEIFFNSLFLSFNDENVETTEDAQTVWQSNIGNPLVAKPAFVVNSNDKENLEIIVTDAKNNLILVTKDGRVRWNIPLGEKLLSEIFQIDFLGNGKLQYLFNTQSKLYLMDRDGNNVAPFPVTLRSPATNGVSVFDYDNNRKFRYFVAGEDKKIYAYDKQGNILSGWNFDKTDFPVTTPVQHFRVSGKDYIVFKDKSRIYILDRRGETRVTSTAKFENSQNPLLLNLNGTPKIVATDNSGKVYYIFFDGKYTEIKTDKFSENHFFNADDLNGDGTLEFVFADGKELTVMSEKGKKLFSEKFKNQIKTPPGIYTFSTKQKKIGVVDEPANRIYLYDFSGKLHEGFPMPGNSN